MSVVMVSRETPQALEVAHWRLARFETWFAVQLYGRTGIDATAGVTKAADRRDRIQELIGEHGLANQVIGRSGGREETFREVFKRLYGVPLVERQGELW